MTARTGPLPATARLGTAAWKTAELVVHSLFPSESQLRTVDVREARYGRATLRSYVSARSDFPIVVLHGLNREGPDDPRLVRFCKMLAAVGMYIYSPDIRGLHALDPDPKDLPPLSVLLSRLVADHGGQIGLIGASFGGTYAILLSASPALAHTIRFVLAIGPYHSLDDVVEHAFSLRSKHDLSPEEAYGLLALDWKYRKILPLTARERALFEQLMADNSCDEPLTREEGTLVAKITRMRQQEDIYRRWKKLLPRIASLSIKGNPILKSLKAPVFLLHNEHDTIIPVDQSVQIESALARQHKTVMKHLGRFGDHLSFSVRNDVNLARFFYRLMLLTESRSNGTPGRPGSRGGRNE